MDETISFVRKIVNGISYYVDENGIVKGEWGGLKVNECEDQKSYSLYYPKYNKYTEVMDYGAFYGIFSCSTYDKVLYIKDDFYLCEKNDRFGIVEINEDYETNVILDVCYKDIKLLKDYEIICESEIGRFYYNIKTKERSAVYDDVFYNYDRPTDCLVFLHEGEYGLIDHHGNQIVRPLCKSYRFDGLFGYRSVLIYSRDSENHYVYIDKGKFFGKIDPSDYYICYRSKSSIKDTFKTFYIADSKINSCWGILNRKGEKISHFIYNAIIDDEFYLTKIKDNSLIDHPCVICVYENKYSLFDVDECNFIIEKCSLLKTRSLIPLGGNNSTKKCIEYVKDGKHGYITNRGSFISDKEYDTIEIRNDCFVVSKNNKYGVINEKGSIISKCDYDEIIQIYGYKIQAKFNNEIIEIKRTDYIVTDYNVTSYERKHYDRYGGYQGYSDEDIDTIFDGDPDAYWNID